jgi:hypothetical protein
MLPALMAEPEKTKKPNAARAKGRKRAAGDGPRGLSARVDRSLKDVDRLLKKHPATSAHDRAMTHLDQARISALLELADAIRAARGADGRRPS